MLLSPWSDILHSYLGLATLSMLGQMGLKPLDATFCTSQMIRGYLKELAWWQVQSCLEEPLAKLNVMDTASAATPHYIIASGG